MGGKTRLQHRLEPYPGSRDRSDLLPREGGGLFGRELEAEPGDAQQLVRQQLPGADAAWDFFVWLDDPAAGGGAQPENLCSMTGVCGIVLAPFTARRLPVGRVDRCRTRTCSWYPCYHK